MHRAVAPVLSLIAACAGWLATASLALADSPAPSAAEIGDPRGGQAASLAGNPGFAIAVVVLVAVVVVVATLAWIRATGGPGSPTERR